jgi:hypothetical protein
VDAGGHHRHLRLAGQPPAVGVVEVDDPERRERGGEQPPLGLEVVVQVGVEVQVVLGEVGEHRGAEAGGVDPPEGEPVARHLHGGRLHPRLGHLGQQPLQVGGLGGGVDGRAPLLADADLDGADHAGAAAGRPEDRLQHVGGGGLAVGAGHPDQVQASGGMVEEGVRQPRQHLPDRADQQLGGVQGEGPLDAERGGAGLQGGAGKVVTVDAAAGHAAEQGTLDDLAGVEDDVGDRGAAVAADLAPHRRGEVGERDAPGRQDHELRSPRRRLGRSAAGTPAPACDRHWLLLGHRGGGPRKPSISARPWAARWAAPRGAAGRCR